MLTVGAIESQRAVTDVLEVECVHTSSSVLAWGIHTWVVVVTSNAVPPSVTITPELIIASGDTLAIAALLSNSTQVTILATIPIEL